MTQDRQPTPRRTPLPGPGHARQALLVALEGLYASPEALEELFDLGGPPLGQRWSRPMEPHAVVTLARSFDVAYAAV